MPQSWCKSWCKVLLLAHRFNYFYRVGQPLLLGYVIRYCAGEFDDLAGYLFAAGLFLASGTAETF